MKRSFILPNKKQEPKTGPSGSTGMNQENSASSPTTEIPTQPAWKLLRRCNEISVARFKQAYCNNDLTALAIEGMPPANELQSAWNELLFEYASSVQTDQSEHTFQMAKQIGELEHHIAFVEYTTFFLRRKYDQEMVDELILLGYYHLHFTEDEENWNKQLDRCISLCKTNVFDLEQLREDYNRLNATTSGKPQTEDEFNKTVAQLAKYQGYRIDQLTVMMDEYISIINNCLTEVAIRNKNRNN